VLVTKKTGVLVAQIEGTLVAPGAGVPVAPKARGPVKPNMLLPNAGCDGWTEHPKGLIWVGVEPKPPKAGTWPKNDDPGKKESWFSDRIRKPQNIIITIKKAEK